MLENLRSALAKRSMTPRFELIVASLFLVCATTSLVHATPRNDAEKTVQKLIGEELLHQAGSGRRLVAPESLKRLAYYADAQFEILPRQVTAIGPWLKENPADIVVLGGKERALYAHLVSQLEAHPGFQRTLSDDPRFRQYAIYRSRSFNIED